MPPAALSPQLLVNTNSTPPLLWRTCHARSMRRWTRKTCSGSTALCAARPSFHTHHYSSQVGSLLVRHFRASVARGLALSARKWATHTAAAEAGRLAPVVESLATR